MGSSRPRWILALLIVATTGHAAKPRVLGAVHAGLFRARQGAKRLMGVALIATVGQTATIPALRAVNRSLEPQASTVVLSAGHAPLVPDVVSNAFVDYFMYTPVVLRQTLRGHRVDWVRGATASDLLRSVSEPRYQNVVLVGHGSQASFSAADRDVSVVDVFPVAWRADLKPGELIQQTCGAPGALSLGDVLLRDPAKAIHPGREVSLLENYLGAWKLTVSDHTVAESPAAR